MSYIGDLRKIIGHDTIMTVGCGVLITNDKDQLLLQKRSDTGDWGIPGGTMETGETYIETATREIREEAGIEVTNLKLFGIYSGEDRMIHYPNMDIVYSLAVIFQTSDYRGEISDADSEVLEYRFFDRDNIPKELFYPDARPILDWAEGKRPAVVK
ncbi:MAG: NUDIX hydrolase [Lachnospiraceae bacterium]|nr:NUDIX hydrolase [Lachnospiraceae bacterium]